MAKLFGVFLAASSMLVHADTLLLRNGAIVTGSWMGVDAGRISFLVDSQIQTYPRADVSQVTFGSESTPVPLAQTQAALPSPPPSNKVIEPDLIGAVYLQDESGKLTQLMRLIGQPQPSVGALGIKLHTPSGLQIKPTPATVRVTAGQKTQFVVKLANGIDPGSLSLLVLKIAKSEDKTPHPPIHFNTAKFGEASYLLTPTVDLTAGEYAFHGRDATDFYCFGVDEPSVPKSR